MALLHFQPCAIFALLLSASTASFGITCDALKSDIERKLASRPRLPAYTLHIVDASASASGRVVGHCDLGARKIVYLAASHAASAARQPEAAPVAQAAVLPAPAPQRPDAARQARAHKTTSQANVVTECKPGYQGADCSVRVGTSSAHQ
jgi:Protein of unknown function (DUF1161)